MATILDIPMPNPATARNTSSKYDFMSLQPGGGGLVELDVVVASKTASRLQSALAAAKKRHPELRTRVFRIRTFSHQGSTAVGIWRVA